MKALHIYIIHCKALKEREASISNIINKLRSHNYGSINIGEVFLIASNDPSDIPVEFIQKSIDYSIINDQSLAIFNQFIKNIHINQLSNTLKHADALNKIISKPNDDLHLVIEDDALFGEDLCKTLDNVIKGINSEPIIFLGLPSTATEQGGITIQPTSFDVIPMVDSYLITYDTAKLIHDNFFPIKFTSVFQMNYIIKRLGIKTYQTNRNVFVNGSKYGMFVSSLNPNNALVFNKDYVSVLELLNKPTNTIEDSKTVETLLKDSPISKSPDFLYLVARYNIKEKKYVEAEKLLSEAYNITLSNNGIVNHESAMLKDFIRLFKHLQVM